MVIRRILPTTALLAIVCASTLVATAAPPFGAALAIDRLLAAVSTRDFDGLAREAAATPEHRLIKALASPDPAIRGAVIAASPHARQPHTLLAALATLAASTDRRDAAPAARTAAEIASAFDPLAVEEDELPRDQLGAAAARFRAIAAEPGRWVDIRIHCLETALLLERALGLPSLIAELRTDDDPEFRQAAFELMQDDEAGSLATALVQAIADEPAPTVAAAATAALCRAPRMPDLAPIERRLYASLEDRQLQVAQRLGLARCLLRRGAAGDGARLDKFAGALPAAARAAFAVERRTFKRAKSP